MCSHDVCALKQSSSLHIKNKITTSLFTIKTKKALLLSVPLLRVTMSAVWLVRGHHDHLLMLAIACCKLNRVSITSAASFA